MIPPLKPADHWLFLDLEVVGERVVEFGAIRAGRELRGRAASQRDVAELVRLATGASLIVGHNFWGFDRRWLATLKGAESLTRLPCLDTLVLSAICFAERPYHPLIKGHKLLRSEVNDPVEDCRQTARVLADCMARLVEATPLKALAMSLLARFGEGSPPAVHSLCSEIGLAMPESRISLAEVRRTELADRCCETALEEVWAGLVSIPSRAIELAFAIAWLEVAGKGSVLPRWVFNEFPGVVELVRVLREASCGAPGCSYCETTNNPLPALEKWFGFSGFRAQPSVNGESMQAAIVRSGMSGVPTFAVLPTGGGKSLCFQLPALIRNERTGALTVVVSPLQSLMKDQVDGLAHKADAAAQIHGGLTLPERSRNLEAVRSGEAALVYLSPEQLRNRSVRTALASREITGWVFDEAHCLSKWGHDFRTDYLYAPRFIAELAKKQEVVVPPIACFTATAQVQVVDEVCAILLKHTGQRLVRLLGGVERENLTFEVLNAPEQSKHGEIVRLLSEELGQQSGSAVVFCATRAETERVAESLHSEGFPAVAYHAGLDANRRRDIQNDFIGTSYGVIAATSAFGMGVDKSDVRLVIHMSLPGSLESYLQQAGRAGRDREPARCVLLYDPGDAETQFRLSRMSRLFLPDIQAIHRSIRRAPSSRLPNSENLRRTVVTRVELMRIGSARARFDPTEGSDHTRVNTAISWLERAELLKRDENINQVFQGSLRTKTLGEAEEKLATMDLSKARHEALVRILSTLATASADKLLSADDIAARARLWDDGGTPGAGQSVLKMLKDLADVGLLGEHIRFTAFVDVGVANQASERLQQLQRWDDALVRILQESAPDQGVDDKSAVELLALRDQLGEDDPEADRISLPMLQVLLKSFAADGLGFAHGGQSAALRFVGRNTYEVRLRREWSEVQEARRVFFQVAAAILRRIVAATAAQRGKGLLVDFTSEDLADALKDDIEIRPHALRPSDVIEASLLLLHDAKVISLQNGLAVFRQAMALEHSKLNAKRQFKKSDYEELREHYQQRTVQIHVMAEYARLGATQMQKAAELALDWFEMARPDFLAKWMPGREDELRRATTADSYGRIVDGLKHDLQQAIVTAPVGKNHLILAGPGAGKTRIVVHRIAWLVRVAELDPAGIFALAYNRAAAHEIRKRLRELIGDEARFVRVQTVHGLAARLCDNVFDASAAENAQEAFRRLLKSATARLSGDEHFDDREQLLAGCTHLLIDEYQDIDEHQAEFVSALVGRLRHTGDARKLVVLAVGDDDQNIYGFAGSDVRFIRDFAAEYSAKQELLVENFRSTRNIIDAANHLIGTGPNRLKASAPIRINSARKDDPAGGEWEGLDQLVGGGRVRLICCENALGVGDFVAAEFDRLRSLDEAAALEDFAVLGRTREVLAPAREALRESRVPCTWTVGQKSGLPLHDVREVAEFLAELKELGAERVRVSEVRERVANRLRGCLESDPWRRLLTDELGACIEAYDAEAIPAQLLVRRLYEVVADQRRTQSIGFGVHLATIHSAKGREFPHVFLLPRDLRRDEQDPESERRLLYVGMTRAEQTLTVVVTKDIRNPFVDHLASSSAVERVPWVTQTERPTIEFRVLGLRDMNLGYAGNTTTSGVAEGLRKLRYGSEVELVPGERSGTLGVRAVGSGPVLAWLAKNAAADLLPRLDTVRSAKVLAVVRWSAERSGEDYRERLRRDVWEVPVLEVRLGRRG